MGNLQDHISDIIRRLQFRIRMSISTRSSSLMRKEPYKFEYGKDSGKTLMKRSKLNMSSLCKCITKSMYFNGSNVAILHAQDDKGVEVLIPHVMGVKNKDDTGMVVCALNDLLIISSIYETLAKKKYRFSRRTILVAFDLDTRTISSDFAVTVAKALNSIFKHAESGSRIRFVTADVKSLALLRQFLCEETRSVLDSACRPRLIDIAKPDFSTYGTPYLNVTVKDKYEFHHPPQIPMAESLYKMVLYLTKHIKHIRDSDDDFVDVQTDRGVEVRKDLDSSRYFLFSGRFEQLFRAAKRSRNVPEEFCLIEFKKACKISRLWFKRAHKIKPSYRRRVGCVIDCHYRVFWCVEDPYYYLREPRIELKMAWFDPEVPVKFTEQGIKLRRYPIMVFLGVAVGTAITLYYVMLRVRKVEMEELIQTALAIVALYASTVMVILYQLFCHGESPSDIVRLWQHVDTSEEWESLGKADRQVITVRMLSEHQGGKQFINDKQASFMQNATQTGAIILKEPITFHNLSVAGIDVLSKDDKLYLELPGGHCNELKPVTKYRNLNTYKMKMHNDESNTNSDDSNDGAEFTFIDGFVV